MSQSNVSCNCETVSKQTLTRRTWQARKLAATLLKFHESWIFCSCQHVLIAGFYKIIMLHETKDMDREC